MNENPDTPVLNQINPIRKFIAARVRAWKVPCELITTHVDGRNETVGDATVPRMCNERIDRRLPFGLRDPCGDFGAGNDPCITFRE